MEHAVCAYGRLAVDPGDSRVKVTTRIPSVVLAVALMGGFCGVPRAFSQGTDQASAGRKVKKRTEPRYPELARQYQLAGKVKIEATVAPDGNVLKTRVVGGSPLLAGAALEAVKQWKYEPGVKETVETIDFEFHATGQ
jgi:TonB family protein